jgi:competence protein ComEA
MFKRLMAAVLAMMAAAAFAAVDVNKATAAELDGIKGIGPGISSKILEERKKGNFKDWNDLVERVKGVGENNAAKFSAEGMTVNGTGFKGAAAAPAAVKKEDKPTAAAGATAPAAKKEDKPMAAPAAAAATTAAAPVAAAKPAADKPMVDKKADAKPEAKADAKADAKAEKMTKKEKKEKEAKAKAEEAAAAPKK